jgi:glycosyltransferase involved in cell wall biosynthesis
MATILVIDNFCPKPYNELTLETQAMGGTESTVIRVTRALAQRGHRVFVAQHKREHIEVATSGVTFIPYVFRGVIYAGHPASIDVVIVLNSFKLLKALRKQFKTSKFYLWMHCFAGKNRKRLAAIAHAHNVDVIGVSQTHAHSICQFLRNYQTDPTVYPQLGESSTQKSSNADVMSSDLARSTLWYSGSSGLDALGSSVSKSSVPRSSVPRLYGSGLQKSGLPLSTHKGVLLDRVPLAANVTVTGVTPLPRVTYVYNPVDIVPHTSNARSNYDPDKLVFFSSPHKGLAQVLTTFEYVRQRWPNMKLYLANPGYLKLDPALNAAGVHVLGSLPNHEIRKHVQSALCVFYPQSSFAETFGLVFAEANAVGTPVLAHDLGSAGEVLSDPCQLVDATKPQAVIERLAHWRSGGRPQVSLRPEFSVAAVADRWDALVDGMQADDAQVNDAQVNDAQVARALQLS